MTNLSQATIHHESQPLREFAEKAYLNYSMYVILDRALPHVGDGLKPVQRRIIYAMSELALDAKAKHKKSVRTVGDVIGKYHPHGDVACYEAMVLMAQDFSYRYPLINGQGNFGSIDDPKSFAAMRYTEAKLSRFAELLLQEIDQGTVDWQANFDGTLQEPCLLPARLPHILLNGSTGIAVGMATDIPPHNLRELAEACVFLLDNPQADLETISQHLPGPDFPTGAEIISSRQDLIECYRTGNGSVRLRAVYNIEEESNEIVVTALPYQVSGAKVLEQIAAQMQAKKLPWVVDLRDESDHENPIRLVILLRSNRVNVEELMSHLFSTTDLERSYRINLNMIGLDGRPRVKGLLEILQEWLQFRGQVVRRRLQFRLDKVLARLHILEGLLIAFINLDAVIHIIRTEDKPKLILMQRFNLTDIQADAILDLKLRQLAKLEEKSLKEEQAKLAQERDFLQETLSSEKKIYKLIRSEILADAKTFGDARRSIFVERAMAQPLKQTEVIASEPLTVILSAMGWVRAAKGHELDPEALSYRAGDEFKMAAKGRSHQLAVFLDSTGRSYSLSAHSLPSARGQGEPLTGRLILPEGANFESVLLGEAEQLVVLASNQGYGFICQLSHLHSKNRNGKGVLTLQAGAKPLIPRLISNLKTDYLAVASNTGHVLIINIASLPMLAKGKGNKILHIATDLFNRNEEYVVDMVVISPTNSLTIEAGKNRLTLKPTDLVNFQGQRGQRGKKLPRALQRVEKLLVE